MVNYLYDLDDIEKNHEGYAGSRTIAASSAVKKLARPMRELVPAAE
jgi:malonyl-CoA decarboxylase